MILSEVFGISLGYPKTRKDIPKPGNLEWDIPKPMNDKCRVSFFVLGYLSLSHHILVPIRSSAMQLVTRKPAWLGPKIPIFHYPLHKQFTEHMYIYWCIQVLLSFPRPAGLGEAAGAGPAGARFTAPPPPRPTCTARRGGEALAALPSASPRRLRHRRWHCRGGCRAEAVTVAKAAVADVEVHRFEGGLIPSGSLHHCASRPWRCGCLVCSLL
jgi:hypothetical protein